MHTGYRFAPALAAALVATAPSEAAFAQRAPASDQLQATTPPGVLVDVGGYRLHLFCIGEGAPR